MRGDWDIRAARQIRSRLKAWNVDIVHAHDARSHALAIGALVGIPSIPLIVTRRVPFTPRSVRLKYGDRVARFIAISRAVRDAMLKGGIDPRRIDVVHSGIAIPRAPAVPRDWRTELNWPADTVVSGVVGAMTGEKGVDLLEAIASSLGSEAREKSGLVLLGGAGTGQFTVGGMRAFDAGSSMTSSPPSQVSTSCGTRRARRDLARPSSTRWRPGFLLSHLRSAAWSRWWQLE
jgi:hypothetical protein